MKNQKIKKWVWFGYLLLLITLTQSIASSVSAKPPVFPTAAGSTIITVEYVGSWSTMQRTALEYAAQIWATRIESPIPITIEAEWVSSPPPVIDRVYGYSEQGITGDNDFPYPGVLYPMALAQALRNEDICECTEILLKYDENATDWYYGLDGNPPAGMYDFVTFTLQQIAFGLGFGKSFDYHVSGLGYWGHGSNLAQLHDPYVVNGAGQQLIDLTIFPNFSYVLGNQLISNNLYFNGVRAITANGGSRPKLYAPTTWHPKSILYLDETAFTPGTPNALLTPVIEPGEAIHEPGPVVMAMLYDFGWPAPNSAPVVTSLPDQMLLVNTVKNNAIDLWQYVADETPDAQLTFAIVNSPDPGAGVSIDNNRYIDIFPTMNWIGQTAVTVEVTDPSGADSTDTFYVLVVQQIIPTYLPLMIRP